MAFPRFYEYVGAFHLHSQFSDGSLSIPEIASIAKEVGLDFLMFTDHNTLAPKFQGFEGWYDRVLVLIGCELNDEDDRNHYLAFRLNQEIPKRIAGKAERYVQWVKKMGGFGIIAHPAEKRNFSEAYPPYPWTAWEVDGFDGIEIWNQMSEWLEGITYRNVFWRIFHPLRSIRFPVWETLERWDYFNRTRRVVGVGGIDVHAFPVKLLGFISLEIYPYKVQFKSLRLHVLTRGPWFQKGKPVPFFRAEAMVFEALQSARVYIVNYSIGEGRGFRFWAEGNARSFFMGERIPFRGNAFRFCAEAPLSGDIRLLCNGKVIAQRKGKTIQYTAKDPGVYRIEIFRKKRGWIYSNPIVLYDEA